MRSLSLLLFCLCLTFSAACQHAPPSLGPAGVTAFHQHEVQRAIDLIRDVAQDANAQSPPVIAGETAAKVTRWHKSAIIAIHEASSGWKATVQTSLDELLKNLPEKDRTVLTPYVSLAKTLLVSL